MGRPFVFSYAHNADARGWGSGWPQCGGARGHVVTVVAGASGAKFPVHARIARLVDILVDYCAEHGYAFYPAQCGAYNCRAIGGTRRPSNHSWGLALDINWQLNPMRKNAPTNIPVWMRNLFDSYGFAWGGNYSGTQDTMHFEFMGTPEQADMMTRAAEANIRNLQTTAPSAPTPTSSGAVILMQGSKGGSVAAWQRYSNRMYARFRPSLAEDGDFGPATVARTKQIQSFLGIDVDGKVGPQTRAKTGFRG